MIQKPDVKKVLSDGQILFKDDSKQSVDVIIFCTGYNYSFPFLSPECEIKVDDNHVTQLYKHIVNINHPTMFFIGLTFITIITFMVEFQVQFGFEFLLNPSKRPSKDVMLVDIAEDVIKRVERGLRKKEMHLLGIPEEMVTYFKILANFAGVPEMKNVFAKMVSIGINRLRADPLGFRSYNYYVVNDEEFTEEIIYY